MQRYTGFPTPPSTGEESPSSNENFMPSPSYISDSSSISLIPQKIMYIPNVKGPLLNFVSEKGYTNIHLASDSMNDDLSLSRAIPFLKIIEEPIDKFRFRYKSEMTGTHGSLNGENSDRTRKMTFPTVQLCNHDDDAIIRCSIWQINHEGNNFMPHAHRLVKKKNHKEEADDPHEEVVKKESNHFATFHSMGIIHTAKKNIVGELIKKKMKLKLEYLMRNEHRTKLNKKEEMEIKGLAEAESKSINLNVVCLRFDAFFLSNNIYWPLCPPVFSHAINNLKSALTGELKIVRMDHCTSYANGGREIFLFVERITKKNIKVRFFELDDDDSLVWEDYGKFNELDVHHQYAIALRTPPYKDRNISNSVNVFMELVRPSDNEKSEPRSFKYIPMPEHCKIGAKRARPNDFDLTDYDTSSSINVLLPPTTIQSISSELDFMQLGDKIDSDKFDEIFENFKEDYGSTLPNLGNISVDHPANINSLHQRCSSGVGAKAKVYQSKEKGVKRIFEEISEFLKTKPKRNEIKEMLQHRLTTYFFNDEERLNAFHVAVMMHDTKMINFFVTLITLTESFELFNLTSLYGTVLHLAVLSNNSELINILINKCKADISKKDSNENTPIHIAAKKDKRGNLLNSLLKSNDVEKVINWSNKDGDTAFHLAVKRNNSKGVRLLSSHGADVDFRHPNNGYTALRFAIENEDGPMVCLLLNEIKVNPKVRDYSEIDPLQAVLRNQTMLELKEIIQIYMAENNISCDEMNVKEEIEDEPSEEDVIICDAVKVENLPTEDVQDLYSKVTHFTEEGLNEVSKILDQTGKWQELAALFDIEHLFRMKIFDEDKSRSKQLLNYVVAFKVGDMKEIRDFLESLDQLQAVQIMDRMVFNECNQKNLGQM